MKRSTLSALALATVSAGLLTGCFGGGSSDKKIGQEDKPGKQDTQTPMPDLASLVTTYNEKKAEAEKLEASTTATLQEQKKAQQDLADAAAAVLKEMPDDDDRRDGIISAQAVANDRVTTLDEDIIAAAAQAAADANLAATLNPLVTTYDTKKKAVDDLAKTASLAEQKKAQEELAAAAAAVLEEMPADDERRDGIVQAQTTANLVVKQLEDAIRTAMNMQSQKIYAAIKAHKIPNTDTTYSSGDHTPTKGFPLTSSQRGFPNVELDKDDKVNIMLKNAATSATTDYTDQLDPKTAKAPATGWTAKQFTKEADVNEGVVLTNMQTPQANATATGMTYQQYFWTGSDFTSSRDTSPITNVTTNGTDGKLDFGDGNYKAVYFTGLEPIALTAGRSVKFLGVDGTLSCSNSSCEITKTVDGKFKFSSDNNGKFVFTPTETDTTKLSKVKITYFEDKDYMYLGYWLSPVGDTREEITTLVGSMGYADLVQDSTNALTGSASYKGGAAGIYELVHDLGGEKEKQTDGKFTAMAELNVNFGESNTTFWAVSGKIKDFTPTAGSDDLSDWTLTLKSANLSTNSISAGFTDGKTDGGGRAGTGTWSASFAGNAGAGTTNTTADNYPEAAFGEFNGYFSNGAVAGVYGAEID